jgi:hypothetical protein
MLKMNLDSLEAVDEPFRALYVEKDGKILSKVDGLEDTSGLKTALQKERKTAAELEKQTKAWKAIGRTPDEIAELLEAQEARAQTEAERKGEWDKLRAQMNDKHAKDLLAKDETIGAMRRRLEAELVDAKATAAIAGRRVSLNCCCRSCSASSRLTMISTSRWLMRRAILASTARANLSRLLIW